MAKQYKSPEGYHTHKCDTCLTIWEHCDSMKGDDEAHKCPNCKTEQWNKYKGGKTPCIVVTCEAITPTRKPSKDVQDFMDIVEMLINS